MSLNIQKIQPMFSDCHKRLNKIRKISFESVRKIPENEKQKLRNATPQRLIELAKMNCYAADKIKRELDKQYGEKNYVIISLGRSLSSICELIRLLGTDVLHLPMSDLRHTDIKNEQIQANSEIMFKKYRESIGLTRDELEKHSDKKYILIDYTHYGRSLDNAYDFLQRYEILDNAQNLIKLPVCNVLGEDYTKRGFEKLFQFSRFKLLAMVGKLSIKRLSSIFIQADENSAHEYKGNITKGIRKLFWFNVFDSMNNKNYKDIFPQKEIDAVYKHYMSPQAVRNYIAREQKEVAKISKNSK